MKSHGQEADICLLLESTYPFIRGGVSSWVHQLISGLPEFSFALFFIGSTRNEYGEISYDLPDNVTVLQQLFIMEPPANITPRRRQGNRHTFNEIQRIHDQYHQENDFDPKALASLLTDQDKPDIKDFLFSERAWDMIRQSFTQYCDHPSFLDYFWLVRNLHQPVFTLAKAVSTVPEARIYHSISTGYAGLLGALLQQKKKKPFLLTEHGIYTKERKIDLAKAAWIAEKANPFKTGMDEHVGYLRNLSIHFFEILGKVAYQTADPIISLSNASRRKQIQEGAPTEKTRVISNGINLTRFYPIRKKRENHPLPVLGFIGRVVPIKDVKTFIRALRILCNSMPEAEGWIIGPEDEDPGYAAECKTLAANLDLEGHIKFLGFQRIDSLLHKLGLLVMTSISEGQPLVILEAFATGLPVIATDVGFCSGMVLGETEEDRLLGAGGRITPIADPSATAHAAGELLCNPSAWREARRAAEQRVDRLYDEALLFDQYRSLYSHAVSSTLS